MSKVVSITRSAIATAVKAHLWSLGRAVAKAETGYLRAAGTASAAAMAADAANDARITAKSVFFATRAAAQSEAKSLKAVG